MLSRDQPGQAGHEISQPASQPARQSVSSPETYIDRYINADAIVLGPGAHIIVPLLGLVVTDDQCTLGKILEETFRLGAVDVEVEGLSDGA